MYTLINLKFVITYLLAYEDGTECSETSAYKIQTPGNYPEENIQHSEHGESLKSRKPKSRSYHFKYVSNRTASRFNPLKAKLRLFSLKTQSVPRSKHFTSLNLMFMGPCIVLTFRLLMSYIYIYMVHLFLMFLDHTQRRSTVGRTPLDE